MTLNVDESLHKILIYTENGEESDKLLRLKENALCHGIDVQIASHDHESINSDRLIWRDDLLYLQGEKGKFSLDWAKDYIFHIKKQYSIKKEPLAKALGIGGSTTSHILDCTLGTGKDSCLLLSFKAKITACERNPLVFLLCLDAYLRACEDCNDERVRDIFKVNMTLHWGGVLEFNQSYISEHGIDFAYYDPMYPTKKKKALPRKEMQVFKDVVGADNDSEDVLIALCERFKNVVVKGPAKGELKLPKKNIVSFSGKTTRYDRYINL